MGSGLHYARRNISCGIVFEKGTTVLSESVQEKIKLDIQKFLDKGGQIQKIPRGVSAEKIIDLSTKHWKKKNV